MTNHEKLIRSGELKQFINDLLNMNDYEIEEKYNMRSQVGESSAESVCRWLQEEIVYVRLSDVVDLVINKHQEFSSSSAATCYKDKILNGLAGLKKESFDEREENDENY